MSIEHKHEDPLQYTNTSSVDRFESTLLEVKPSPQKVRVKYRKPYHPRQRTYKRVHPQKQQKQHNYKQKAKKQFTPNNSQFSNHDTNTVGSTTDTAIFNTHQNETNVRKRHRENSDTETSLYIHDITSSTFTSSDGEIMAIGLKPYDNNQQLLKRHCNKDKLSTQKNTIHTTTCPSTSNITNSTTTTATTTTTTKTTRTTEQSFSCDRKTFSSSSSSSTTTSSSYSYGLSPLTQTSASQSIQATIPIKSASQLYTFSQQYWYLQRKIYTTTPPTQSFSVWWSCLPFPDTMGRLDQAFTGIVSPRPGQYDVFPPYRYRMEQLFFQLGLHWRISYSMRSTLEQFHTWVTQSYVDSRSDTMTDHNDWQSFLHTNLLNDWLFLQQCCIQLIASSTDESSSPRSSAASSDANTTAEVRTIPPHNDETNTPVYETRTVRSPVLPQKEVSDPKFGVLTPLHVYPEHALARFYGYFSLPSSYAYDSEGSPQKHLFCFPSYGPFMDSLETTTDGGEELSGPNPLQRCLNAAHAMFGSMLTYGSRKYVCMSTLVTLVRHVPQWIQKLKSIRDRVERRYSFCYHFEDWLSRACAHLKGNMTSTWRSNLIRHPVAQILAQVVQNALNEHCKRSARHVPTQWGQWKEQLSELWTRVQEDTSTYQTIGDVTNEIEQIAHNVQLVPNDIQRIQQNCRDKYIRQQGKYLKRLYNMTIEYYLWQHPGESLTHSLPVCPHWLYEHRKDLRTCVAEERRLTKHVCDVWIQYLSDCRVQWVVATMMQAHLTSLHPSTRDLPPTDTILTYFDADFVRRKLCGDESTTTTKDLRMSIDPCPKEWNLTKKQEYPPVTSKTCFEEEQQLETDSNIQLSKSRVHGRIVSSATGKHVVSIKQMIPHSFSSASGPVSRTHHHSFLRHLCALLRVLFSLIHHGKWSSVTELQAATDQIIHNVIHDQQWGVALYMVFMRVNLVWIYHVHGKALHRYKTNVNSVDSYYHKLIDQWKQRASSRTQWFLTSTHWTEGIRKWTNSICEQIPCSKDVPTNSATYHVWACWYMLSCCLLCKQTQWSRTYMDMSMQKKMYESIRQTLTRMQQSDTCINTNTLEQIRKDVIASADQPDSPKSSPSSPSFRSRFSTPHLRMDTQQQQQQPCMKQKRLDNFAARIWHLLISFGCLLYESPEEAEREWKKNYSDKDTNAKLRNLFPWYEEVFERGNVNALPSQKRKQKT